jgi:hypothetical protein
MPGIRQSAPGIHSIPYRIPNWHPARSKVLPFELEQWFSKITGIKGPVKKFEN